MLTNGYSMELSDLSRFEIPAEFAPHERCWLVWPSDLERWGDQLDFVQGVCADVAAAIAEFEPVTVLANPDSLADASIRCGAKVAALPMPHDDPWLRDGGLALAITSDGSLQGVTPGAKADAGESGGLAEGLLSHLGLEARPTPLGRLLKRAFIHDGEGTAIVSERALSDSGNDLPFSRQDLERSLSDSLGIEKVVWLLQGLVGEDDAAAIDNLVCFAAPGVVLALTCNDSGDDNYPYLADNLACLEAVLDAKERPLQVIEVPQPPRREGATGMRLPISYLNLYIANGGVVVPGFEVAEDATALQAIAGAFPDREVVQVPLRELIDFGGGIHRMTLSQPQLPTDG